jgi:hypothetical protein
MSGLCEGWVLKKARKNTRFSAKVKEYLLQKFQIGESTKQKVDRTQLSTEMHRALDEQGNRLFTPEECLKAQQIRSFLHKLQQLRKKMVPFTSELLDDKKKNEFLQENETAEQEEFLQSLKSQAISSVCYNHPLIFDRYNICELLKNKEKFKRKFSIAMLLRICEHFEINVDGIIRGRKESYVNLNFLWSLPQDASVQWSSKFGIYVRKKHSRHYCIRIKTQNIWRSM